MGWWECNVMKIALLSCHSRHHLMVSASDIHPLWWWRVEYKLLFKVDRMERIQIPCPLSLRIVVKFRGILIQKETGSQVAVWPYHWNWAIPSSEGSSPWRFGRSYKTEAQTRETAQGRELADSRVSGFFNVGSRVDASFACYKSRQA
jgi:hypothetical protein